MQGLKKYARNKLKKPFGIFLSSKHFKSNVPFLVILKEPKALCFVQSKEGVAA